MNNLLQTIESIEHDKRVRGKAPFHALFLEIASMHKQATTKELKSQLYKLVKAKKITWGRTINDIYFKIKKQDNE